MITPCLGVGLCTQPPSTFGMDRVCTGFMHAVLGANAEEYPKDIQKYLLVVIYHLWLLYCLWPLLNNDL